MEIVEPTPENVSRALEILRDGGIIAHATETCYGLAADMTNLEAILKLFAVKQRPHDQPVSALFPSVEAAKEWVEWNDVAEKLAISGLPGPLTLILPIKSESSIFPTPTGCPTIGIRVSSHPIALELASEFGRPISTTSANVHDKPTPYSAEEIRRQYESEDLEPDLILDSGKLEGNPPSQIMNLAQEGQILR